MKNETKKHYNPTRILARFRCLLTSIERPREINLLSQEHASELDAALYVRRELERWAMEKGNAQHDTVLELLTWSPYPTE